MASFGQCCGVDGQVACPGRDRGRADRWTAGARTSSCQRSAETAGPIVGELGGPFDSVTPPPRRPSRGSRAANRRLLAASMFESPWSPASVETFRSSTTASTAMPTAMTRCVGATVHRHGRTRRGRRRGRPFRVAPAELAGNADGPTERVAGRGDGRRPARPTAAPPRPARGRSRCRCCRGSRCRARRPARRRSRRCPTRPRPAPAGRSRR